ncbi:hypothetical protein SAMN05443582_102558 [Phyllobacterium sp. OV277]|nr:hypothetical protein SAMN05443582_102558 [Phyllobacterium sp. OV277]
MDKLVVIFLRMVVWVAFTVVLTPLCPVGHLPHKGGDQLSLLPLHNRKRFKLCKGVDVNVISSLWGRCPTGQRGVFASANVAGVEHSFLLHQDRAWFDRLTMRESVGRNANRERRRS